jgi:hypothetical protein
MKKSQLKKLISLQLFSYVKLCGQRELINILTMHTVESVLYLGQNQNSSFTLVSETKNVSYVPKQKQSLPLKERSCYKNLFGSSQASVGDIFLSEFWAAIS